MHCQISPGRMCNPCGYTMKMSPRNDRLLIYDIKRTAKIDCTGPFILRKLTIKIFSRYGGLEYRIDMVYKA